ncbi:DUF1501 domain-containing protein [Verrucomicrobiaceae bacterium N1E253]|uniref:DUF1501 domain-containing protein n=1 Tax=Oceaniferula marina TaxID=2748318 RepID=A0A851GKT1_9BACT|nr:DUF1501 domain-containing protein [Oceaniferula marina]NWK55697.1 DUF1501 domain-containing protein [Oceaniferula marina]
MNPNHLDELSRRGFLATTAKTCFGLTIGGSAARFFSQQAEAADPAVLASGGGTAKSVIYLFMSGGMTHLDTFDPKPEAGSNVMGETKAISTNVDGIQLGHCLPKLAQQMDQVALIRSMSTTQGAHAQGRYYMRTGYAQRSSIVHPAPGAWVERLSDPTRQNQPSTDIPSYITVNCGSGHPGAGFMEARYAPLPIGDASTGLQNSLRRGLSEQHFDQQLALRQQLDADFDARYLKGQKKVRAYNEAFDAAVKLMRSKDLEAFDLSKESQAAHKLYGPSSFSKGVLLARRLVERGVRFIEVEYGGFDWHADNFGLMEEKIPTLDQALAALLHDLKLKGLLDSTLVVLGTEFGRSPKINENAGRNHYPKAFSCLMAGGGIRGGQTYGATDAKGGSVTEGKINAQHFNATIAHALGLPHDQIIYSESKRPFRMGGREGKPLTQLFT